MDWLRRIFRIRRRTVVVGEAIATAPAPAPSAASAKAQAKADAVRITAEARADAIRIGAKAKARVRWMAAFRRWLVELRRIITARAAAFRVRKLTKTESFERKHKVRLEEIKWVAKFVRVQIRLTTRAISRFFQRRFDEKHRLATFTALAVMLVLIGFLFSKPRVWEAGLVALVIIGIFHTRKWWKKWKAKQTESNKDDEADKEKQEKAFRKLFSFRKALLLLLGFVALTFYGIIVGNLWIKAFAPVGAVWSLGLPLLPKKTYLAYLGKVAVFLPPLFWIVTWLVFRFRG